METLSNNTAHPRRFRGLGFGILLIVVGAVLLGINLELFRKLIKALFSPAFNTYPDRIVSLLQKTAVCLGFCLDHRRGRFFCCRKFQGFSRNIPGMGDDFTAVYWPFLLICAGLIFIAFRFLAPKKDWSDYWKIKSHHYQHKSTGNLSTGFEKNTIFGSGEHIILDEVFKGGEMNAIFGGATLDLRRTKLPEGDTYLVINAIFGGITLYIPGDWTVVSQLDAVFGGFDDKRRIIEPVDKTRRLIVKGSCIFGGGEIIG
jgi:hypothetical protein